MIYEEIIDSIGNYNSSMSDKEIYNCIDTYLRDTEINDITNQWRKKNDN